MTVLLEGRRNRGKIGGRDSLGIESSSGLLLLIERSSLDLALGFKRVHDLSVLPAAAGGEVTENSEGAVGAKAENAKRFREHHLLHLVVRVGHTVEHLEASHGSLAAGGLVGDHAPDRPPEDLGRSVKVNGAALGVGGRALPQKVFEFDFVAVKVSADVQLLAANDNNPLSSEEFLRDNGREAAKKVATAVDGDGLFKHFAIINVFVQVTIFQSIRLWFI